MFPLYLLAAQGNLGLRRAKQCEDFLGMACWLSTKVPEHTTNVMMSQLHRLYGQLHALQGHNDSALGSFAQDVYCCSQDYGPLDVRTSLGLYNLGKIFEAKGELGKAVANYVVVTRIWINALAQAVLDMAPLEAGAVLAIDQHGHPSLPLGTLQLMEVRVARFRVWGVMLAGSGCVRKSASVILCQTLPPKFPGDRHAERHSECLPRGEPRRHGCACITGDLTRVGTRGRAGARTHGVQRRSRCRVLRPAICQPVGSRKRSPWHRRMTPVVPRCKPTSSTSEATHTRAWPMCDRSYTVTPHTYMLTAPLSRGTNTSLRRVIVLCSVSTGSANGMGSKVRAGVARECVPTSGAALLSGRAWRRRLLLAASLHAVQLRRC